MTFSYSGRTLLKRMALTSLPSSSRVSFVCFSSGVGSP